MIGALIDGKKLHYEWNDSLNTVTFYFFLERFIKKHPRKKFKKRYTTIEIVRARIKDIGFIWRPVITAIRFKRQAEKTLT